MRYLAIALLLSTTALAAEPTTRPTRLGPKDIAPKDRPAEVFAEPVIDARMPAFVPQFAKVNNPPAGAGDRDWARTNTTPAPFLFSHGYGYFRGGCTSAPSHAFVR